MWSLASWPELDDSRVIAQYSKSNRTSRTKNLVMQMFSLEYMTLGMEHQSH